MEGVRAKRDMVILLIISKPYGIFLKQIKQFLSKYLATFGEIFFFFQSRFYKSLIETINAISIFQFTVLETCQFHTF